MDSRFILTFGIAMCLDHAQVSADSSPLDAETQLRRALAKVDARWTEEASEPPRQRGTAVAIGRRGRDVYFVTARHVIVDQESDELASNASLYVAGCPSSMPIKLDERWLDHDRDLALFLAQVPEACLDRFLNLHLTLAYATMNDAQTSKRGHRLTLYGRGNDDRITAYRNDSLVAWQGLEHFYVRAGAIEGNSGGVVATEDGHVLGIVQWTQRGTIISLVSQLAETVGIPTTFLGPHAELEITGAPAHAYVSIDDDVPRPVRPKYYLEPDATYFVALTAYEREPVSGTFTLEAHGATRLCAQMDGEIDQGWRTWRWPVLGLSGALLVAASVTGIAAASSKEDFLRTPSRESFETTNTLNLVTDISLGAGALALVFFGAGHWWWNASATSTLQVCR